MNMSCKVLPVLMLAFLCSPASVNATLISGSVSNLSGTQNIPYSQPSSATLRWSMLRTAAATQPGVTVSSLSGTFTDASGSLVLGTVSRTLSKSIPLSAGSSFTFTETVRIPRDILFKAYKQNIRTIFYRRDFTDCPATRCNVLAPTLAAAFNVTGSTAAAFGISDYRLRFSDGGLAAILPQHQMLTAEAQINVTGAGVLRGVWEVATPGSTAGKPFYQSLQIVTRQVSSGQTLRLHSPALPSRQTGNYLVRFRFLEPALSEEPPMLQYVVRQEQVEEVPSFGIIDPANNAVIDQHTLFEWQPVNAAASYKLEVVSSRPNEVAGATKVVTGILIKSEDSKTRLTLSLLQKLKPGKTYWWHVEALDDAGSVIAATDWRKAIITD